MSRFARRCKCGGQLSWAPRNRYAEAPSCEWCGAQLDRWNVVDETGAVILTAHLDHGPVGAEPLMLGLVLFLDPPRQRAA